VPSLFAPTCSITRTKRGRFFWAAWWTGAPTHVPFRKPDASDGAAKTPQDALAAAEKTAGMSLVEIDALWARAWMRMLRGRPPWPSDSSRRPRSTRATAAGVSEASIWSVLGVSPRVTDAELKAAYRKRALETHPDQGGDEASFRRVVAAYAEARRRLRKKAHRPKRTATRQ
jgi:hypothetical protein